MFHNTILHAISSYLNPNPTDLQVMWQAGGHVLNRQVTHLELPLVLGQLGEQLVQVPAAENNH